MFKVTKKIFNMLLRFSGLVSHVAKVCGRELSDSIKGIYLSR